MMPMLFMKMSRGTVSLITFLLHISLVVIHVLTPFCILKIAMINLIFFFILRVFKLIILIPRSLLLYSLALGICILEYRRASACGHPQLTHLILLIGVLPTHWARSKLLTLRRLLLIDIILGRLSWWIMKIFETCWFFFLFNHLLSRLLCTWVSLNHFIVSYLAIDFETSYYWKKIKSWTVVEGVFPLFLFGCRIVIIIVIPFILVENVIGRVFALVLVRLIAPLILISLSMGTPFLYNIKPTASLTI